MSETDDDALAGMTPVETRPEATVLSTAGIASLTAQGLDALRQGKTAEAERAFSQRDQLANQLYGNAPVPSIAANGEVVPPVEGSGEPHIGVDELANAELMSALSQSVSGRGLTLRDVPIAKQNALKFERTNPEAAAAWETYGRSSADALGEITARLARGEIPNGGPERYKDELDATSRRHAARRELEQILETSPPGSEAYRSSAVQRRVAALHQLISGHIPIVGSYGRTA